MARLTYGNIPGTANAWSTLYTVPATKEAVVEYLVVANTTAAAVDVKVRWTDSSASNAGYAILDGHSIPAGQTVEFGSGLGLQAGDVLQVQAATASALTATVTVDET